MHVLIATDGSEGSFEATSQVGAVLRKDHDRVTFFCHPPNVRAQSGRVSSELLSDTQRLLATTIVEQAKSRLPSDIRDNTELIVGHQDARNGILVAAKQTGAELIVLGARGLGPFKRLLLGSVSRSVVHAAEVPVWVARPRTSSETARRVLLASKSPEEARHATDLLAKFGWPRETQFAVLTVLYSVFAGRVPDWLVQNARSPDVEDLVRHWVREHDAEIRTNQERLAAFVSGLAPPLNSAKSLVAEGDLADKILSTAAEQKSDLIVVGTRKWTMGTAILGSVTEAVLNHAPCSVIVVPHLEAP